jgi:hypothetical protein
MRMTSQFLRGLDAGLQDKAQCVFAWFEGKGSVAPAIHRDVSCCLLSAIAVFAVYATYQASGDAWFALYVSCAVVAGFVEMKWLRTHTRFVNQADMLETQRVYAETAVSHRAHLMPLRLAVTAYLLVSPFLISDTPRLDVIGWLLVFIYWVKFYFFCCFPGTGPGREASFNLGKTA